MTGRSGEAPTSVSKSDLTGGMCFLLYTGGDESKLNCVARAACESPVAADNYLAAAKMWYKMHKLIQAVPFSEKYNVVMETRQVRWELLQIQLVILSSSPHTATYINLGPGKGTWTDVIHVRLVPSTVYHGVSLVLHHNYIPLPL